MRRQPNLFGRIVPRRLRPRADESHRLRKLRHEHADVRFERQLGERHVRAAPSDDGNVQHLRVAVVHVQRIDVHVGRVLVSLRGSVLPGRDAMLGHHGSADVQFVWTVGERRRVCDGPAVHRRGVFRIPRKLHVVPGLRWRRVWRQECCTDLFVHEANRDVRHGERPHRLL